MTSRQSTSSSAAAHETELRFHYGSSDRATLVAASVAQEAGEIDGDRTRASVECDDSTVVVTLGASDLVALRAGLNTWCSLVEVAERAADRAETET